MLDGRAFPVLVQAERGTWKAECGTGNGECGESVGSDVVSCVEANRSLLLGRIMACKKQGLTPGCEGACRTGNAEGGTGKEDLTGANEQHRKTLKIKIRPQIPRGEGECGVRNGEGERRGTRSTGRGQN